MSLDEIRAAQHMDVRTQADWQLDDFLAEIDPEAARLDLLPRSEVEIRHLVNVRTAA